VAPGVRLRHRDLDRPPAGQHVARRAVSRHAARNASARPAGVMPVPR